MLTPITASITTTIATAKQQAIRLGLELEFIRLQSDNLFISGRNAKNRTQIPILTGSAGCSRPLARSLKRLFSPIGMSESIKR